jgi:hypothetical protein
MVFCETGAILAILLNFILWYGIIIGSYGYFLESRLPEFIVISVMVMYVNKPN